MVSKTVKAAIIGGIITGAFAIAGLFLQDMLENKRADVRLVATEVYEKGTPFFRPTVNIPSANLILKLSNIGDKVAILKSVEVHVLNVLEVPYCRSYDGHPSYLTISGNYTVDISPPEEYQVGVEYVRTAALSQFVEPNGADSLKLTLASERHDPESVFYFYLVLKYDEAYASTRSDNIAVVLPNGSSLEYINEDCGDEFFQSHGHDSAATELSDFEDRKSSFLGAVDEFSGIKGAELTSIVEEYSSK